MNLRQLSDEENERVRDNLRTAMAARGWNQTEAAVAIGCKPQTLSMFLTGKSNASRRLADAIIALSSGATSGVFTASLDAPKQLSNPPLAIITTALLIDRLQGRDAALAFFAAFLDREAVA